VPGRVDYSKQAESYDRTRAASPSVVEPLRRCLSTAPGRRLLDVGGGTGNYAIALRDEAGFDPVVVDASPAMVRRATEKGLAAMVADAEDLPFPNERFDAVTMISMLHQVVDWRLALAEARRVLVPGGNLAVKGFARENLGPAHWLFDYFPSARRWMEEEHQTVDEIRAELPGSRMIQVRYTDLADRSMAALCREPELLLDEASRTNNSFFQRLQRDNPGELAIGLADLWRDLTGGRRPHEEMTTERARGIWGDAIVVCWTKPGGAQRRGAR
jgi:demethylmenaquinone methyltransferase/2-methoxy-6-polyprenyl-1,4-benzoquinol methylase